MGLSYDEFGDTTPYEFEALQSEYRISYDIHNLPFGVVCSVLANLKRNAEVVPDPFKPQDFFPRISKGEEHDTIVADEPETPIAATEEQVGAYLDAWCVGEKSYLKSVGRKADG